MASTPVCRGKAKRSYGKPQFTTTSPSETPHSSNLIPDNLITEEAKTFGVDNFIALNTFYGDDTGSKDLPKTEKDSGFVIYLTVNSAL